MVSNFSYQVIESVFDDNQASIGVAEAHGILAGLLCVDCNIDSRIWSSEVFHDIGNIEMLSSAGREIISSMFQETRRVLVEDDFDFDLLLPDDDVALDNRADAFRDWCRGFLYGLGFAGEKSNWPGDCTEVLGDIVEISRLDSEADGEDDENAYRELTEYVRVGVQLVQNELKGRGEQAKCH